MDFQETLNEINAILQENNSTLTAIDKSEKPHHIICKCNKCGNIVDRNRSSLKSKCPVCSNKKIVKGINDIATTRPEFVQYFKNKEDAYKYSTGSNIELTFVCPRCGTEKKCQINTLCYYGFSCPVCSETISRPNKFIRSLLRKLPVNNLQFEYSAEWTCGKRYDAYFVYNNEQYVIEMDGAQHYVDTSWRPYEEQKEIDEYKDKLAKDNDVHLIRICCKKSSYTEMIENIKKSELYPLLLSQIDINWNDCVNDTEDNMMFRVCKYYEDNNHPLLTDIENYFKLAKVTVRKYLRDGGALGYCIYDKDEIRIHRNESKMKEIDVKDEFGNLIGTFKGQNNCCEQLKILYPDFHITRSMITEAIKYRRCYNGLYFSPHNVSFEEQFGNNEELHKICDYYNSHPDINGAEISKVLSIKDIKVYSYLRIGNELGLCHYTSKEAHAKTGRRNIMFRNGKNVYKIKVYNLDNEEIGNYSSLKECIKSLKEKFKNLRLKSDRLSKQLRTNNGVWTFKDFKFVRV